MKFITCSLSHEPEVSKVKVQRRAHQHKDCEREHEILLDTARLDAAQVAAEPPCSFVGPIASIIHNEQINVFSYKRSNLVRQRAEEVQDTVNQTLIDPFVDKRFCEPVSRFDQKTIIDFIKVILVLEKRDLKSVFCR